MLKYDEFQTFVETPEETQILLLGIAPTLLPADSGSPIFYSNSSHSVVVKKTGKKGVMFHSMADQRIPARKSCFSSFATIETQEVP